MTRFLVTRGRLDEALPLARSLKANRSERIDAWVKKAEALSFLGDDQGVLDSFAGAERDGVLKPPLGHPLLFHLAAVAALRLGRVDEARRRWQEALKLAPGLDLAAANLADLRKPVGERHAPWAFTLDYWVSRKALDDVAAHVSSALQSGKDAAIRQAVDRALRQHPEVVKLTPLLLDRGDAVGRELALRTALALKTPEMLVALRDFALGQRGPDSLRIQAAEAAVHAGLIPAGEIRRWLKGQWSEALLIGFEISGEAASQHGPTTQKLADEGMLAVRDRDGDRARRAFQRALEAEPESPDLLNNLAAAYQLQGRHQEAEAIVRSVHERFPDYLFGRTGMAHLYLKEGKIDEAKALLQPLLARARLHPSELAALCLAQFDVSLAEGKDVAARAWLDFWAFADPDHPGIPQARQRLSRSTWPWVKARKR